jgi:outer membrane protein TolC
LEQARKREQVETYRQTILTALQEVEDSLSNLLKAYEDEEKNEVQIDTSRKDVALSQAMYQHGLQTKLDLLRAENELLLRESKMIQSKSDQLIGVVSLYKALGGGY